ncbi:uncharacterized protein [Lolium perenne]|uniref:uncharacterized protein isoform X1 n=1 Tax=Lolium perenne TaxID=4522 RepID=UPI0021F60448|nr:uncharacterized protein LOC127334607 [Lolium perenne]
MTCHLQHLCRIVAWLDIETNEDVERILEGNSSSRGAVSRGKLRCWCCFTGLVSFAGAAARWTVDARPVHEHGPGVAPVCLAVSQGIDLDQHFDCKIFFASGQLRSHLFETHTSVMKELTTIECVNAIWAMHATNQQCPRRMAALRAARGEKTRKRSALLQLP